MSFQIKVARTEVNAPLNLVLTDSQGPVTGATVVVALRDGDTTNSYLDFNDDTFKAAGWTTRQASLAEGEVGVYTLAGGQDISAITNLPAATDHLLAEYEITAPTESVGITSDIILLEAAASGLSIADVQTALTNQGYTAARSPNLDNLDLAISTVDTNVSAVGAIAVTLNTRQILIEKLIRNRLETDPVTGIATLYDDDNITPLLTALIFEDVAAAQAYQGSGLERRNRFS